MRKSQSKPQIGDLFAKAGTPDLLWVVHRMLPDIDPAVPHVELLRLGDASTRVTISMPALADIRMFLPVENDGSRDRQLADMGFGRTPPSDEPPAAARDADRVEAAADAEVEADITAEAPPVAAPEDDDTGEGDDDRVTQLYPADRADDALESLESIDDIPASADPAEAPAAGEAHVPEDTAEPAFDPPAFDPDTEPLETSEPVEAPVEAEDDLFADPDAEPLALDDLVSPADDTDADPGEDDPEKRD